MSVAPRGHVYISQLIVVVVVVVSHLFYVKLSASIVFSGVCKCFVFLIDIVSFFASHLLFANELIV